MRLALFQPDIPQNTGTLIRLGACLGVPVDIIEPCGFVWSDTRFRRAGLDYLETAAVTRHPSWEAFRATSSGRLVLLTTKASRLYTEFAFKREDIVLLGRESAGAPQDVWDDVTEKVRIPMKPGLRSLNVAVAGAMVLGEALRQVEGFP